MAPSASARPTLARVAQQAGVSVSTASLAFSGAGPITRETRDRVLEAARLLGYSGPNPLGRQLRSGRSGIIGVVIGDRPWRALSDPVSVRVLDGLIEGLGEHGLGVLLVPGLTAQLGVSDPETAAKVAPVDPLITSAGMDVAVLVWGANGVDDPNLVALQRRGVRVVIGEGPVVDGAPVVGVDDRGGAAAAVQHLVDLGHRRIAEVAMPLGQAGGSRIAGDSGSDAFSGNGGGRLGRVEVSDVAHVVRTSTRDRMVGVRDVVEPVLTWETPASLVEHGRDAAQAILGPDSPLDEPPTAIFAHTDLLAAGVVIGARELGLTVPGDLSVVGFDGIDIPWLAPDVLTSVHQPLRDKGAALGRAVVGLLAGEPPARDTLPVHLVEGTTTAALEPGI